MNLKRVPVGIDNFKTLIEENYYFVDKTKSIETLIEKGAYVVLYPRPRRFGKSLFISMLDNFFDIDKRKENEHLFDGLAIQKSEYYKEFGAYPVITLDFKDLKQSTYESVYNQFVFKIQEVYTKKEYLMEILNEGELERYKNIRDGKANEDEYKNSIYQLSNWLERYHHKKTIILVDEYDVPIQEGYIKGVYDQVIDLIRSVLSSSLKGNDSLKMGVMTGVLRVSKESIFSDLNNPKIYDMMSPTYNEAFGFTEEETKELLEYYGLELTSNVKAMYDGYNFMGASIYNPWSILNYAEDHILKSYWMNTSGNELIIQLLNKTNEENKLEIEKLIQGESSIFRYNEKLTYLDFEREQDLGTILNLMFASGYLTLDKIVKDEFGDKTYVRIPNHEVKELLLKIISYNYLDDSEKTLRCIDKFTDGFKEHRKDIMESSLNELLISISYMDTVENFYHGYMLGIFGAILNANYIVKSNREAGNGRFDVLVEKTDRSTGVYFLNLK